MNVSRTIKRLTAVVVLSGLLAACGGGGGDGGSAGDGTVPDVAENQTLTIGVATLQQQYADPVLGNEGGNTYAIKWAVGEPLVRQDMDTTFVPALATEWSVADDQVTWTFKLRDGVKMHDGSDFTAQDVITSIERVKDPEFTSYASFSSKIASYRAIDDLTLEVVTNKPYGNLPVDIPAPVASEYYKKVGEEEFRKAPMAAGQFMFDSQTLNDSMTFKRFDDFWDKDRIPNFTTLVLKIIPDESSRVAAIQTGQIDIAQGITPNSAAQLEGSNDIDLVRVESASTGNFFFYDLYNNPDGKFADVRVRQALTMAIDRESIASSLYKGFGAVPANVTFPITPGNDESLKAVEYDPEGAKKLLAEAGASDLSFDLTLYSQTTAIADVQKLAEAVAGYWEEIGVKVNIKVMDPAAYLDQVVKHQIDDVIILGMPGLLMSDPSKFSIFFGSTGADATVEDPKLDQMFSDMDAAVNPDDKAEIASTMSTYLYEQSYAIPAVALDAVYAVGPKVAQFETMQGNPYAGPFWYLRAK